MLNASRQIGTALGVAVFASLFQGTDSLGAVHLAMACAGGLYLVSLGVVSLAREEQVGFQPRRVL